MEGWREEGRESWMDGGGPRRGRVHVALGPAETGLRGNCALLPRAHTRGSSRTLFHTHTHAPRSWTPSHAWPGARGRARTREDAQGREDARG